MKRTLGGMALGVVALWLSPLWPSTANADGQDGACVIERGRYMACDERPANVSDCLAEDGGPYPCVWDGAERGDGQYKGKRFTVILRDDTTADVEANR